jgi:hypothetical protein
LVGTYQCFIASCWFDCQHRRVELRCGLHVHWHLQVLRFHSSLVEYSGFSRHDMVSDVRLQWFLLTAAWHHISREVTVSHSSGSYWPDWMASHLRRHDIVSDVRLQWFLLTAAWHHIMGDTTHCHIPAVLADQMAWYHIAGYKAQCHIPAFLTDRTDWYYI